MQAQTVARALETAPVGTASALGRTRTTAPGGASHATKTFQNQGGAYCREFQQEIIINSHNQKRRTPRAGSRTARGRPRLKWVSDDALEIPASLAIVVTLGVALGPAQAQQPAPPSPFA